MTTYYARNDVLYSGGDKLFSITFSYIKRDHIKVFINEEETENFTFNNDSQILINDEITVGDLISIRRNTPIDTRMVVFSDTSILNKDNQNLAQTQMFDAVQEMRDDNTTFQINVEEIISDFEGDTNTAIEAIETIANTAKSNSETALEEAGAALSYSNAAVNTANAASTTANSAASTANSAKTTAETASGKVDAFGEDIESVLEAAEKINELEEAVETATTAATNATTAASTATTAAQTATNKAQEAVEAVASIEQADWDVADTDSKAYIKNKPTIPAAQIQADWEQSDNTQKDFIKNKPTIPVATDVQINGTSITSQGVANIVTNSAYNASSNKIATMSDLPSVSGFEQTSNKVTSISSSSTDTQYPSAKSVWDNLTNKADLDLQNVSANITSIPPTSLTNFDGQWVPKFLNLSTASTVNSYTHDLSSYLPNDNQAYEIFISLEGSYGVQNADFAVGTVPNPVTHHFVGGGNIQIYSRVTVYSKTGCNAGILPVGVGTNAKRTIYSQIHGYDMNSLNIYVYGYRRIGTNV